MCMYVQAGKLVHQCLFMIDLVDELPAHAAQIVSLLPA